MTTAAEKRHLARIADLGCILCGGPAEVHHIRHGAGMGRRNGHYLSIPLCPMHHRLGNSGVAYHSGRMSFEAVHGTELDLLDKTLARLLP